MTDDFVKRLRELHTFAAEQMSRDWDEQPEVRRLFRLVFSEVFDAADRIEQLEAALKHIWAFYPISVSNPRETIDAIRDFAFTALGEKKDD
jgi:hypothetical protein